MVSAILTVGPFFGHKPTETQRSFPIAHPPTAISGQWGLGRSLPARIIAARTPSEQKSRRVSNSRKSAPPTC